MARGLCAIYVVFLVLVSTWVNAEVKELKPQEVLNLRNYELSLQNAQLRIEILQRDMNRLQQERDGYIQELYKGYGVDSNWKIDLEKGIWFNNDSP